MKASSTWCCTTSAMKPAPMTHIAASTGPRAESTSASSQIVEVFRAAFAAWRSSICASWLSTTVTIAIAISDATHSSMPMCWLRNSVNWSMPVTLAAASTGCQRQLHTALADFVPALR
jgi:hypothetical protein